MKEDNIASTRIRNAVNAINAMSKRCNDLSDRALRLSLDLTNLAAEIEKTKLDIFYENTEKENCYGK